MQFLEEKPKHTCIWESCVVCGVIGLFLLLFCWLSFLPRAVSAQVRSEPKRVFSFSLARSLIFFCICLRLYNVLLMRLVRTEMFALNRRQTLWVFRSANFQNKRDENYCTNQSIRSLISSSSSSSSVLHAGLCLHAVDDAVYLRALRF